MSTESNADVYASFGVNSAVMSGSTQSEHEQNMLALDVAARDGDDAITLNEVEEVEQDIYGSPKDPFGIEEDDGEGRIQVRIGEEGEPAEDNQDDVEMSEGEDQEFQSLGDAPEELKAASEQLAQHEAGLQEMIEAAAERGLSQESIERIQQEYEEDGISEASYEELAKAGYSRTFVDSYIRGQEALVESYVKGVMDYAGGREQFDSIYSHLQTTNPEAANSLSEALENRDINTIKAIINLAGNSRAKTFGSKPQRSVAHKATPAKPAAPKREGFANRAEMVKAMSDSRYRTDSAYRRMVEQKVIDSDF